MKKIRVLQLFQYSLTNSGVDTVIKGISSQFDKELFTMDLLTAGQVLNKSLRVFLKNSEVKYHELNLLKNENGKGSVLYRAFVKPIKIYRAVRRFLKNSKYDVVHIHYGTILATAALIAAAQGNRKRIILHAHISDKTSVRHEILKYLTWFWYNRVPDYYFSCSEAAANYTFNENIIMQDNFKVLKSLINISGFSFDTEIRRSIRANLCLDDRFIVGMIGRICYEKNNLFALEIFREIQRREPTAVFLIVGEGEDERAMREKVVKYNLRNAVIFYGVTDRVSELYQAIDVLLFPSNFEGLGLVAIEAQSAGLPVIASTNVPKEVECTRLIRFLSLGQPISDWAETALEFRDFDRRDTSEAVKNDGWDIASLKQILTEAYSI
ncbi:MAG: glycosyltransferase [Synergistaceae bacterium]|nr:glycosyltransferase [Synergistaceae bacterium]